jgi:hypothetical protein
MTAAARVTTAQAGGEALAAAQALIANGTAPPTGLRRKQANSSSIRLRISVTVAHWALATGSRKRARHSAGSFG